jgi:FkbM family methyltransferase
MITWHGADRKSRAVLSYLRGADHPAKLRLIRGLFGTVFSDGLTVVNDLGAKLKIRPDDYIARQILWERHYEGESLALAAKILADGGVFVDIGANRGLYTCSLGVLPKVECIAIEPHARNFVELQENLALNPAVQARLFNLCLSRDRRLLDLQDFNADNSGTVRVVLDDQPDAGQRHTVSAVSLNEIMTYARLSRVTLLKIDVEGYELPVLEGLDWESPARPANVLAEYTDYVRRTTTHQGKEALLQFFEKLGYEGFTIRGEPLSEAVSIPESNAWFKDQRPR